MLVSVAPKVSVGDTMKAFFNAAAKEKKSHNFWLISSVLLNDSVISNSVFRNFQVRSVNFFLSNNSKFHISTLLKVLSYACQNFD